MAQPLPCLQAELERRADQQELARILIETGASLDEVTSHTVTRAQHADPARLRGLPAVGRGCSGAIAGSDPLKALLAKERRRR
jgi:hypothetical protein